MNENYKVGESQLSKLNDDITIAELIYAIDSLKDYTAPGQDRLLSRDFTILLHIEALETAS